MLNDRFAMKDGRHKRERSYVSPPQEERQWAVVDASNQILGRLASQVAAMIRGKHKPDFTPHIDTGDNVIVINAAHIRVTGRRLDQKIYYRHTGYIGGLKSEKLRDVMERDPAEAVRRAVNGMLPHTRLGRVLRKRLRVYNGPDHPHEAQKPSEVKLHY